MVRAESNDKTMRQETFRSTPLRPTRRRRALTILELLVALAILFLLVALLLPAINEARSAARRTECLNQLHEIGLAIDTRHELRADLPCGWKLDASGTSAYGWLVDLLPFMEAGQTQAMIDRKSPLNTRPIRQPVIPCCEI